MNYYFKMKLFVYKNTKIEEKFYFKHNFSKQNNMFEIKNLLNEYKENNLEVRKILSLTLKLFLK